MLSFSQFIVEDRQTHIGFIRPDSTTVTTQRDRPRQFPRCHDDLAKLHGFKDSDHAQKKGWVRYYHTHEPDASEAGYSFHTSPKSKKLVADHLAKSGGFPKIYLDHRSKNKTTSHQFKNTESARNHLEGTE